MTPGRRGGDVCERSRAEGDENPMLNTGDRLRFGGSDRFMAYVKIFLEYKSISG